MEQYIKKSTLVAEIERLIKSPILYKSENVETRISVLEYLLSFLDTFEVKEVDLNKKLSYEDYKGFFEKYPDFPDDWGFEEARTFAQYFFELGLKTKQTTI